MPATGLPLTGFNGIKTNMPLQKVYMSGAVRRDLDGVTVSSGGALTASTAYPNWCIVPRASLITGIYLVLGVVPTVAAATLTVTANGVSLLAGANFSVLTTLSANTIYSIPLSTVLAVSPPFSPATPTVAGLPYLPVTASGFPYPILVTYTEGASTVHSANVAIFIEFEPDDFVG
jgi:hypothetical protein